MQAAPFISGESYTFSGPDAPEGQTYSYSWSASDGSPLSSTDSSFLWIAPIVSEPTKIVIGLLVSNGAKGCTNESQLSIQVIPKKIGDISLEKTLDTSIDPDNINVRDIITYIITITNTGETNVTHLPLADVYPNEFLKAVDSTPPWSTDESLSDTWDTLTLKRLVWDNLLEQPLTPGDSVTVTARFQVIRFQEQIMNLAWVEGAKDDTGASLEPKEKDFIIAPVQYECPSLGPDTACVGEEVHFSSPLQNLPSYQWEAMDENGNPVGGFNDTNSANVTWTAPGSGSFMISFNDFLCSQTVSAKSCEPAIKINKTCDFESPVTVGDTVTYHFEVTNTGDMPLHEVNLTDVFNWGPNCEPTYISGDDGNDVLDPGESWLYECHYVVPDPMDYPKLHIMGAKGSAKMLPLIRRLMDMKVRLEIEMGDVKSKFRQFDPKVAALSLNEKRLNGVNYALYNYTNEITGESLSNIVDSQGRIHKFIYINPISGAILSTTFDQNGTVLSDELYFPPPWTKEYLKIEYDVPSPGYRTFTIADYKTGNTLILVVDELGNILSKEYRKTPGYRPYAERYFLKNTASVKAKDPNGQEVSDSDSFSLEIFLRQPMIRVTKVADPDPVKPDGTLNYTIAYENLGGADAHEVILKETYNKSLIFQWADPAPDIGTIDTWTLGDLLIGESGTIKIRTKVSATAQPGSKIRNIADLSCKENSRDVADINTTVAGIGLNITKSASAGVITPGASLTYSISYKNEGLVKQTNVVIHDYLDANVDVPSFNPVYSGYSGNHYWWYVGDLNPGDEGTIEISVRVKEPLPKSVTSIINTYRMNSLESEIGNKTLQTLVVQGLWIDKKADVKEINRDENITYTIRYGNADPVLTATGVTIEDTLPPVELLGVSRSYTQDGSVLSLTPNGPITLNASETGTIMIIVHVPKEPEMNFKETSSVQGEGYVYVRKKLSTAEEKPALVNSVKISGWYEKGDDNVPSNASSSAKVTIIGAAGTRIRTTEHGSGHYEEDEISSLKLENRSITLKKEIFAKHRPTTFSLPGKRSINYNSLWFDLTRADNRVLNEELSENYLYADTLSKNSSFVLDKNQTVYKSEAQFSDGLARINYQKHSPDSKKVTKFISEDYHGSFKVLEAIDSYGDSVKYAKSATGKGFVASDVRPSTNQKSYEYGSGYYNSEEMSQQDLLTKSTKMLYAPLYQTAGSQDLGYFIPWKEGMWTKDPEKGLFIGQEIRYASFINKDAGMMQSRLSFLAEFNGTMDIKLVSGQSPKNETRRLEQIMVGSFKTDTAFSVYTNPMHLNAHVYVTKEAIVENEKEVLFLINITNDGNQLLKPLIVTDCMPEGLIFINSSLRPEVKGQVVTWKVPALDISRTMTIKLRAKIKGDKQWYYNEVNVKGTYKNTTVQANNSTFFQAQYEPLPCCNGQSDQRLNITKIFSFSKMTGDWGDWSPAPCFGVSSGVTDCFNESKNYYDYLERFAASCKCVAPYDIP